VWLSQSKQAPARTKHDGKYPFNQNRGINKYETNKISENIGSGGGLRGSVQLSARAGHEHNDDDRRIDRGEHYQHEYFKWLGHN